jgi:membrane dipeptidase
MIVDGHEDIAHNVLINGRDFTQPVAATRAREGAAPAAGSCTIALPELLAGGVGLVFGTLFTMPASAELPPGLSHEQLKVYHSLDEAHQQAAAQMQVYRTLAQREDVCLVQRRADLHALRQHWQQPGTAPRLGIVVLMEGGDPIRTPDEAAWWQAQGVRIVGPAWQATQYCGGTRQPGPLTAQGRALLAEMSQAGLILDTSHLAEESFWQALDAFDGPLIASHSNCRALLKATGKGADRHLSDAMLRAIIARDGVIGVVLFNIFLDAAYQRGQPKDSVGLQAVLRHIDHICQLAGSARHVAIGSDMDGGFGSEGIPRELDSAADLPRLGEALRAAGYSETDTAAILGGNWLRVLERSLPE